MACLLRNITDGYERILKVDVAPQEALDLEEIFKGFCKPKRSSKKEKPRFSMFKEDQFDEFVSWVISDLANDRGTWKFEGDYFTKAKQSKKKEVVEDIDIDSFLEDNEESRPAPKKKTMSGKQRKRRNQTKKQIIQPKRPGIKKNITPREIAYLPMNDDTEQFIQEFNDYKALKAAHNMVRMVAGQEKLRKLIENRMIDLEQGGMS